MTGNTMAQPPAVTARPTALRFNTLTFAAAATAAISATASASLGWSVWAMFIGWVAFFTGGHTAKAALFTYLCLAIGIGMGVGATLCVGALMPLIGPFAFGAVVFVVAMIVVSLRAAQPLNNVPAYFLGLIAFFAAHLPLSGLAFAELAAVSALGLVAAWFAHQWQSRILR